MLENPGRLRFQGSEMPEVEAAARVAQKTFRSSRKRTSEEISQIRKCLLSCNNIPLGFHCGSSAFLKGGKVNFTPSPHVRGVLFQAHFLHLPAQNKNAHPRAMLHPIPETPQAEASKVQGFLGLRP